MYYSSRKLHCVDYRKKAFSKVRPPLPFVDRVCQFSHLRPRRGLIRLKAVTLRLCGAGVKMFHSNNCVAPGVRHESVVRLGF
jgi:hypothetical protein